MSIHLLYADFFRFLDRLPDCADPWELYREIYLEPHREVLTAYIQQVMRVDEETWRLRAQAVRPQHYSQLREVAETQDLPSLVEETLSRCAAAAREVPGPDVVLLVGFFSPDGFLFRVREKLCIGIGMERWRDFDLLPLFVAHEYGHYLRRNRLGDADTSLAEAIAAEGVAIAFSQRVYPQRPLHQHLRTSSARLRWWREHASLLWGKVMPHLRTTRPDIIHRFLAGDAESVLSRSGAYLGYTSVAAYAASAGLEVGDPRVISAPAAALLPAGKRRKRAGVGEPLGES